MRSSLFLALAAFILTACPASQSLGVKCVDCDTGAESDTVTCYPDNDGDGYGNGAEDSHGDSMYAEEFKGTECPARYADNGEDQCDGNPDAWTYDDCNTAGTLDSDGDGYESPEDCDDTDADVNPDADEYCDGVDNDCDGAVDESSAVDADTWFYDGDNDGYGDPATMVSACREPFQNAVQTDGDCDDENASVHPGATEVNNDVDDDCDGDIDEGTQADLSVWWLEVDEATLSIADSVFQDSLDIDGVRVVGYGFGGEYDWSYSNGHEADYDDGWFSYDFEDGIYRVTFRDSDEWALYEGYCVSSTDGVASPLCWENLGGDQGSGYSLCLGIEASQIYVPTDEVCADTPEP